METEWYTSARFSGEHDFIKSQLEALFTEEAWYIGFPHMGKNKDNPHFHVFFKYYNDAGIAQYRRKFRTAFGIGNRFFSVKRCKNGIASAITYGSKEGTDAVTKGPVDEWIANAPPWVPGVNPRKRKRNTTLVDPDGDEFDGGVRVNKYNLVAFAYQFWKKNMKQHKVDYNLDDVFKQMLKSQQYSFHFTEKFTSFHFSEFRSLVDPDHYVKWWNWSDKQEALVAGQEQEAEEKM